MVPSEQQFAEWREVLQRNENVELAKRYVYDIKLADSVPEWVVKKFIDEASVNRNKHWDRAWVHPVTQWLVTDRAYVKARDLMFRRLPPAAGGEETAKARRTERLLKRINKPSDSFELELEAKWWTVANYWPFRILNLIDDYLHVDMDGIHAARRAAQPKIQKIKTLLDELRPGLEIGKFPGDIGRLEREVERLEIYAARVPKRNLQHKKERWFVRNFALLNMTYGNRAPKQQVIAELMTMEVFERQLDMRTLFRICAELTSSKPKS